MNGYNNYIMSKSFDTLEKISIEKLLSNNVRLAVIYHSDFQCYGIGLEVTDYPLDEEALGFTIPENCWIDSCAYNP